MTLTFVLKGAILSLYNISEIAQVYASQMMSVYAFVVLFQSFCMVSIVGVLRGGGDSRYVAIVDVLSIWLVAVPLGFLSGHVWGLAAPVVYAMIRFDEVVKACVIAPRLLSGKWISDMTKGL
jgi:Na+-driven multidrug efflux pump